MRFYKYPSPSPTPHSRKVRTKRGYPLGFIKTKSYNLSFSNAPPIIIPLLILVCVRIVQWEEHLNTAGQQRKSDGIR